jgi:iron complex outermembrane recepter protein
VALVCLSLSDSSLSQPVLADDGEDAAIEEIVVTGSRIPRRDFYSPSPLITLDRETLDATGRRTLEETLNQMPQVQPDLNRSVNNGGDGTAAVNLRGIGAGRTLVLMNGRRVAPSGTGSAVDVNNLPQALIDRVEIITGGAGTVYGSDAIAGVVNFITRDDIRGLHVDASYSISEDSDARIYDLGATYGLDIARGAGHVTLYAGLYDREALLAGDRELTRTPIENIDETGELVESGTLPSPSAQIFAPPVDFGSGLPFATFTDEGLPRALVLPDDYYNYQPLNYLQTPLRRLTAGVLASIDINGDHELYVEAGLAENESEIQLAEVPAVAFVQVNTDNPVLAPATRQFFEDNYLVAPGIAAFGVGRRLSEVGPRISNFERAFHRIVAGVRGPLGRGWDYDAWLTYSRSDESEFLLNDGSRSRFAQGLLVDPVTGQCFDPSGGCVPLDIFGAGRISPEAANFLRVDNVENRTERVQKLASIVVTGSPADGWAGPIDTAFGLEWRSDRASFEADEILFTGDTLGNRGAAPVEGTETVIEAYGEALIPLVQNRAWADYLALEVGARYSRYDYARGVWTYKYGLNWDFSNAIRFRAMQQRSVRAPNNAELFTEQFVENSFFVGADSSDDPCSASNDPIALGYLDKCVLQGLPADQVGVFEASSVPTQFIYGGNPELVPEAADTTTLGVVFEPAFLPNWQFSVDYFDVDVTDSIGDIAPTAICFDERNTDNLFCANLVRDAAVGYNVVEVLAPTSNRGRISSRGIDTQLAYAAELPDSMSWFGDSSSFALNLYWTHLLENSWQLNPTTGVIECTGLFGNFCPLNRIGQGATFPENRVSGRLRLTSGPVGIDLVARWIDGSDNSDAAEADFLGQPAPLLGVPSIGSRYYLDLGISYDFDDWLSIRFGIDNLTDTDAPLMPGVNNNTDAPLYDVYGRSYFLTLATRIFGG